ncbi:MAG TPA: hypothetical protein VI756_25180 [Blastocatellia bacterium]
MKIFLDTTILHEAFALRAGGDDWRAHYRLPGDAKLLTSQKNVAEMYGCLKTNMLEDPRFAKYGLNSSKKLRDILFNGADYLSIFWSHQVLENTHRDSEDDRLDWRLTELIRWRNGYERVCSDFEEFLEVESIEWVLYGLLFREHEWQWKIMDLARETLMPSEDWEIVAAACFAGADIFLTDDSKLVRLSWSLGWAPRPVFSFPEDLEKTICELAAGLIKFRGDPPKKRSPSEPGQ